MATTKSPLILIVDDDYDFLEINRMILERAGYRVVTAAEPKQALARMEEEKPDLVITDLMMTSLDSGFFLPALSKKMNASPISLSSSPLRSRVHWALTSGPAPTKTGPTCTSTRTSTSLSTKPIY